MSRDAIYRLGLPAVLLAAALLFTPGCAENNESKSPVRMMKLSSREHVTGYKDGMRDAKNSWTDSHGGWMWLWMMEKEYRIGYEKGWQDGRRLKKMADEYEATAE